MGGWLGNAMKEKIRKWTWKLTTDERSCPATSTFIRTAASSSPAAARTWPTPSRRSAAASSSVSVSIRISHSSTRRRIPLGFIAVPISFPSVSWATSVDWLSIALHHSTFIAFVFWPPFQLSDRSLLPDWWEQLGYIFKYNQRRSIVSARSILPSSCLLGFIRVDPCRSVSIRTDPCEMHMPLHWNHLQNVHFL